MKREQEHESGMKREDEEKAEDGVKKEEDEGGVRVKIEPLS